MPAVDGQFSDAIDKRCVVYFRSLGRYGEFARLLQITARIDFYYVNFA